MPPTHDSSIFQEAEGEITAEYFKDHAFHNATGRPDVLILNVRHGEEQPANYLLTGVTDSADRKTVRRGSKETMESLAVLQLDGEYVFGEDVEAATFGDG